MDLDVDDGAGPSQQQLLDLVDDKVHMTSMDAVDDKVHMTSMDSVPVKSNRKRRCSSIDSAEEATLEKVYVRSTEPYDTSPLLNLSDEVLLEILKNCNSTTLHALSLTCERFMYLVCDRILWKHFDFADCQLSAEEITRRFRYVNDRTTHVAVRGLTAKYPLDKWNNNTITAKMLERLIGRCPKLQSLAVHEAFLNFQKINMADFPSTLKKLTLCACEVLPPIPPKVLFNKIDLYLVNLEELNLEKCRWFETHDLIIFSKLPQLKKLNLSGCKTLKDCVPYGSIATRFGFHKLEVLDIRDTLISDSDIQCFNITTTLRELLMECPEKLRNESANIRLNNAGPGDNNAAGDNQPAPAEAGVAELQIFEPQPPAPIVPAPEEAEPDRPPLANIAAHPGYRQIINIVVQDRNYVNINNERQRPDEPQPEDNAQQQLIIVRGLGLNRDNAPGRLRNRISWELVPANSRPLAHPHYGRTLHYEPLLTLVSDRGICSFGSPRNNVQEGVVWIRAGVRSPNTFIERLVVRHYKLVTDVSLRHLLCCSPNLKILDVTGTSVTEAGVRIFKLSKPQCVVISNFGSM